MKKLVFFSVLILRIYLSSAQEPFIVKPYLQIGQHPSAHSIQLLWQSTESAGEWSVEYKTATMKAWRKADSIFFKSANFAGFPGRRLYQAAFNSLEEGGVFNYRLLVNKKEVFTGEGKALKNPSQPYRFVAVGDLGAGTPEAKQISGIIYGQHPDMVVVSGDIIYDYGLAREYDQKFWPIYNSDKSDTAGNPILRSVPWAAAPGNHDSETRDLDKYPDALSYFYY